MAGKSTLMKSFAIAVYMAHMGFPVAAKEMNFSLFMRVFILRSMYLIIWRWVTAIFMPRC